MPAARDQLTQRLPMGSALKTFAIYDTPFWRADGLSGLALDLDGPMTFDASRPDGPGMLCTLLTGPAAQQLAKLDTAERRATIIRSLVRGYGPHAARPVDWREKNWADDPYCRGGYNAYFPPGVLTSVGSALRTPVGRIHWAGSETAIKWAGYIEGAIRSGERAADEILQTKAKFAERIEPD
ncbi:flavin monoamine oxidase family protein [Streptomyces netropsis]